MATDKITARRTGRSGSDVGYAVTLLNRVIKLVLNRGFTEGGIATATTPAKAKTVATIVFVADGEFAGKNATDDFWTLSGTTVAVASFQVYHLYIDVAGAASMAEGTQSKVSLAAVRRPALPEAKALVGWISVQTVAATFVPGTTSLAAGGQTVTFFDGIDKAVLPEISDLTGGVVIADELSVPPS